MKEKRVFTPSSIEELLKGWNLHAHKGRDRQDEAARTFTAKHTWLGSLATAFAAIVGTSIFATITEQPEPWERVAAGMASMLATVLMALQTFYNFAARAEKHRTAGARYKAIIRRLERHFTQMATLQPEDPQLKELQGELDDLEENAEVIIHRIYNRVEKKYSRVVYVSQAAGLLQPPSDSMNET